MRRLAVDIIDTSTVSYCVRIGKTSTEITIDCDAADLRALKSCIDTTLGESNLSTCSLGDETAVAVYPTREDDLSYQLVVTVESTVRSLTIHRRQLAIFASHDIESALAHQYEQAPSS